MEKTSQVIHEELVQAPHGAIFGLALGFSLEANRVLNLPGGPPEAVSNFIDAILDRIEYFGDWYQKAVSNYGQGV